MEQTKDNDTHNATPPSSPTEPTQPTQPPRPASRGPELFVEKLPFEGGAGERFKWSLQHDGRLLAMGMGDFADNYAAAQDAANVALTILNSLASSYCQLARQVEQARAQAQAQAQAQAGEGASDADTSEG